MTERNDSQPLSQFYAEMSDIDVARHINLSLLMCQGISEQDAGFDTVTSVNDAGLKAIARAVAALRVGPAAGPLTPDGVRAAIENLGYDLKLREFAPRTEIGIRNFNERCEYLAAALSRPHQNTPGEDK